MGRHKENRVRFRTNKHFKEKRSMTNHLKIALAVKWVMFLLSAFTGLYSLYSAFYGPVGIFGNHIMDWLVFAWMSIVTWGISKSQVTVENFPEEQ